MRKQLSAIVILFSVAFFGSHTSQAEISTNSSDLFHAASGNKTAYGLYYYQPTNHVELFNGTNLDGFTFCMTADADPAKTWVVTNGVIHCTGAAVGYLRTLQSYSNYVVTVVWRFIKVEPKKDNTGVMVHMQLPDKIWPMCIQNQGKSGRQGDLFVMSGVECKEHLALGKDANTPVALHGEANENAIGEWNTNVTVCAGNDVKAIINGKLLNEITECTVSSGFVGIQSEGADFEIRSIDCCPLKY
jgi:Domain of Unknown Function (DUF1080)